MIPVKFGYILPSSFRGDDFFLCFNKSKTRINPGVMFLSDRDKIWKTPRGPCIKMLQVKYCSIWPRGFRRDDVSASQKQVSSIAAMILD